MSFLTSSSEPSSSVDAAEKTASGRCVTGSTVLYMVSVRSTAGVGGGATLTARATRDSWSIFICLRTATLYVSGRASTIVWCSGQKRIRFVCLLRSASERASRPRGPCRLSATMCAASPTITAGSVVEPGSTSGRPHRGKAQMPPDRAKRIFNSLCGVLRLTDAPDGPSGPRRPWPRPFNAGRGKYLNIADVGAHANVGPHQ